MWCTAGSCDGDNTCHSSRNTAPCPQKLCKLYAIICYYFMSFRAQKDEFSFINMEFVISCQYMPIHANSLSYSIYAILCHFRYNITLNVQKLIFPLNKFDDILITSISLYAFLCLFMHNKNVNLCHFMSYYVQALIQRIYSYV